MLAGSMKNCLSESRPCPTRAYYSLRARGERVDVAIKKRERESAWKRIRTKIKRGKEREGGTRERGKRRVEGGGREEERVSSSSLRQRVFIGRATF